jgi:hypothetical protein
MEANVKLRISCACLTFGLLLVLSPLARGQAAAEKRAQEQARADERSNQWPVRLFQVKYANVYQLARVFNAFGAIINADGDLKVISVRAPQPVLDAIDEALKRLDVPQPPAKNIELNAYLITGSPQSSATPLPAELEPVVKQLKSVFSYQGFKLLGTLSLRGRDGSGGSVNGVLPPMTADVQRPATYQFHVKSMAVTSDDNKARVVRINDLALALRITVHTGPGEVNEDVSIATSVDAREGQKVVVGKANIDNAENALILVLTAKVID